MNPKKHYLAKIPTIALFILFAMSPPVGILLFILKSIDKKAEKEERAAAHDQRSYSWDIHAADARPGQQQGYAAPDGEPVYGHDRPTLEQKKAKEHHKTITTLCTIFGVIFLLSGVTSIGDAIRDLTYWGQWSELLSCLAQTIGGGGALWLSLRMKNTRKLERLLDKIVGERDNIPLPELFAAAGIDPAKGRSAVESAIEHGYFGADAYIDFRTDTLIVRGEAPQPPAPEPVERPAAPGDRHAALLQQLRKVNNAIPDPIMSAKITRLEQLSSRIFALAKEDEAKAGKLQKFTDYYLPTALSLLNKYASLSAQDVQGQNITEAKQNIERSMDLLITAFENQLDKLFQSDALDVSTDIAALQGMLNLDGLTGSDFSL